jgi:hypothetical protein
MMERMPSSYGRKLAMAGFLLTIACAFQSAEAQTTAASAVGQCQQQYEKCESDPNSDKAQCESVWRSCVSNKCKADDTTTVEQCPKDPDCDLSCTVDVSSEKGLISCCLGGPQHDNLCLKELDNKCTPATLLSISDVESLRPALPIDPYVLNPNSLSSSPYPPLQPVPVNQIQSIPTNPNLFSIPFQNFVSEPQFSLLPPVQLTPEPSSYDIAAMFNTNYLSSLGSVPPAETDITLGATNALNNGGATFIVGSFSDTPVVTSPSSPINSNDDTSVHTPAPDYDASPQPDATYPAESESTFSAPMDGGETNPSPGVFSQFTKWFRSLLNF